MASDSIRRGLDWRAFSVLDTYKNGRGISISFGSRTSTAISAVGGLRDIHLRRCHHRDSLGGAVHLSRNNRQPQSAKALAGAVADRDCGCSFLKQRNFPQRTTAFASGCIPDLVVAVACGCRYERSGTSRGNCSRNIAISLIDLQSEQRRNVANRAPLQAALVRHHGTGHA